MSTETEKQLYIWDGINGELEEVASLEDALKFIKENFSDHEEGIHPDISSVFILQRIADVSLVPSTKKEGAYKITLTQLSQNKTNE